MSGVLDGRIAVITGAASGFGAATARRFHAEGASVVVADLDAEGAKRVAESLGGNALGLGVDVSKSDQVAAMIDAALSPDPPRRLLLGSDAYRLVHAALAARLAEAEAQQDLAASTDVDGWLPATP